MWWNFGLQNPISFPLKIWLGRSHLTQPVHTLKRLMGNFNKYWEVETNTSVYLTKNSSSPWGINFCRQAPIYQIYFSSELQPSQKSANKPDPNPIEHPKHPTISSSTYTWSRRLLAYGPARHGSYPNTFQSSIYPHNRPIHLVPSGHHTHTPTQECPS